MFRFPSLTLSPFPTSCAVGGPLLQVAIVEAIATTVEAMANGRVEAIASRVEAIAGRVGPSL